MGTAFETHYELAQLKAKSFSNDQSGSSNKGFLPPHKYSYLIQ